MAMRETMRNKGRGRRLAALGAATATAFSVLAGGGAAQAAPVELDNNGLVSSGRVWEFANSGIFSYDDALLAVNRLATDAFDGGLELKVDGTSFFDGDGVGNYNTKTNTTIVGPSAINDLSVTRWETAKGPYVRSLVRLRNVGAVPFNAPVQWESDLGSDGSGVVNSSSSGLGTAFEKADRWMVTSQPGATGWEDDPALGFVLFGKKAPVRTGTIATAPDNGSVDVEYTVKVPAGKTRYLLFFTEMHSTPGQVKRSMAKYDAQGLNSGLLSGISTTVRKQILNWNL